MIEEDIKHGNKLIAEFMGAYFVNDAPDIYPDGYYMHDELDMPHMSADFQFHELWDWLMPVVDKIRDLQVDVNIGNRWCIIDSHKDGYYLSMGADTSLESVYISVIEFIKHYNKK